MKDIAASETAPMDRAKRFDAAHSEPAVANVTARKPSAGFTPIQTGMDIARPDLARKRRRKRIFAGAGIILFIGITTLVLSRLEPAAPRISSEPWLDTVKRGDIPRQVHGNGTLVPELIQLVQAESAGTIQRILVQPGAEVEADTVIIEMANPELKQSAFDAEWAVRAAQAQLDKFKVSVESDRLGLESLLATLRSDSRQAALECRANEELLKDGLVPNIEMERVRARAQDLQARVVIDEKRLQFAADSARSQLAVQEAEVEKLKAQRDLKQQLVRNLNVRAGIAGVLTQLGDREMLQSGQRVTANTTLGKVVVPTQLKAEIRVAETQARDIALNQKVEIDTRNGLVPGHVMRVDPAVQNGTVLIDVKLDGPLPKGSRPDLSVEGTVELELLQNVLYVTRPAQSQSSTTVSLFRMQADGKHAARVTVKLGRSSVSLIEVIEGLQVGDRILLTDMSQHDGHDRVRVY